MEIRHSHGNITTNEHKRIVSGYAIKWEKLSKQIEKNGRAFRECFLKGSFEESLRNKNQLALVKHEKCNTLASASNDTLLLREDEIGLYFEIVLPGNGYGKRTFREVENKKLKHVSISFRDAVDTFLDSSSSRPHFRFVRKADLVEISLVESPAYIDTCVVTGRQYHRLRIKHMLEIF